MAFSQKTLDFLFENRAKDSRDWFNEHRGEYEEFVLTPMRELVGRMAPAMLDIDPAIVCAPKVDATISRIWRDTRFSKDKSIFRDVMWLIFIRDKKLYRGLPGFFFEISPFGSRWGCGWYQTSPEVMDEARALILENRPVWRGALEAYKSQSDFVLGDERYKRARFPDRPEDEREWLEQKSLCVIHEGGGKELLFSDALAEHLTAGYKSIAPIYEFFMYAQTAKPIE